MAKIRIYELARDLNMTNKVLLEKIRNMDIDVKSHMSSLEDEVVSKVKANLFGKKVEEVEITRIKPTIIRRRRKVVKEEPVMVESVPEPAELEQVSPAEVEPVAPEPTEKVLEEIEPPVETEPQRISGGCGRRVIVPSQQQ